MRVRHLRHGHGAADGRGAIVGGLLFRAGYALPFVFVIMIAATLLVLLAVQRRHGTRVPVDAAPPAGQTD